MPVRMLKLMYIPMHFNNLSYMCASMLSCYAVASLVCIDLWCVPDIDLDLLDQCLLMLLMDAMQM